MVVKHVNIYSRITVSKGVLYLAWQHTSVKSGKCLLKMAQTASGGHQSFKKVYQHNPLSVLVPNTSNRSLKWFYVVN